jgi:flagellar motor switch protein FliG
MNALTKPSAPERTNVDLSRYTGAEKAAIILLSLGDEAKHLWEILDD